MRKIWNQPDWPVWSISTRSGAGEPNCNTATYVNAVSLDPKLMTLAVYHGTKTNANLIETDQCLLQLLTEPLAPTVRICGRQSGHQVDKLTKLQKRFAVATTKEGFNYFTAAAGYAILDIVDRHEVGGDHTLMTGRIIRSAGGSTAPILTTAYLRTHHYIR